MLDGDAEESPGWALGDALAEALGAALGDALEEGLSEGLSPGARSAPFDGTRVTHTGNVCDAKRVICDSAEL